MDRFVPYSIRRSKIKNRFVEDIRKLAIHNVENLRWATLQNLDRAFRHFGSNLDERLQDTITATHGAIQAAWTKRREQSYATADEVKRFEAAVKKLERILEAFEEN